MNCPTKALILAAGMGVRLRSVLSDKPKGLLELGEKSLIQRSVEALYSAGIQYIGVVIGHQEAIYRKFFSQTFPDVVLLENKDFAQTGSMHSLYCAQSFIDKSDFLLLESDILYERRAITALVEADSPNCVLLSGKTSSGDEVYAYGTDERLESLSKKVYPQKPVIGELVGLNRISRELYQAMCKHHKQKEPFPSKFHYEDMLTDLCPQKVITPHLIPDLVWCEIDNPDHYKRAQNTIYPNLLELE